MKRMIGVLTVLVMLASGEVRGAEAQQWSVFETSFESDRTYSNAFMDVEVNVERVRP